MAFFRRIFPWRYCLQQGYIATITTRNTRSHGNVPRHIIVATYPKAGEINWTITQLLIQDIKSILFQIYIFLCNYATKPHCLIRLSFYTCTWHKVCILRLPQRVSGWYFRYHLDAGNRLGIDKNIVRHTAHTIVSWPNPKQWLMIHTSGLMMIIR